jgi:streptogramin lyase
MRWICFALLFICRVEAFSQLHQSIDFTREHLFTNNIEGPCFHKGILYVVNYQQDGTIGAIKPDGSVALFVTLPAGSTANAIQFDNAGNMLLADFTGHNILKVDMQSKTISVCASTKKANCSLLTRTGKKAMVNCGALNPTAVQSCSKKTWALLTELPSAQMKKFYM